MQTGDIVRSVKWGKAIVIKFGNPRSTVKFLNTGNIYDVSRVALYNGGFSDPIEKSRVKREEALLNKKIIAEAPFKRTRFGIGYLGVGKYTHVKYPEFSTLWGSMLKRCYGVSSQDYYADCVVCNRWHNFQNFCEDIQNLPGYSEWSKFEKGEGGRNLYQLDKDTIKIGNKEYCSEKCKFITHTENASHAMKGANASTYKFVKDGVLVEVFNLTKWCKDNGFGEGSFRQMLMGNIESSKGFVLYDPSLDLKDHPKPYEALHLINEYVGKDFVTNNCGVCRVLEYANSKNVTVVFLDTGSVVKTHSRSLRMGCVRDPYLKKYK